MAISDSVSTVKSSTVDHQSSPTPEHYTGVVVIHGLGSIKRNTTLQENVNTLAYWFNHKAQLSLRREGIGRIWVRAKLTDDPNPDAAPAKAFVSLVPPKEPVGSRASGDPGTGESAGDSEEELRLEFREVWWAESFGVPSITSTIAWGRVQGVEQATHLLLPITNRLG